ncbi:MAG: GIY-YIG nuclease family protein [Deltaproteobacteria bacterium]|nr:GIY-YIG nuclease family protein [Deltaproteobacteria bacterium]
MDPHWSVYILRCRDGSLYTGIAKDVPARVSQHNQGRGAAYTRTRLPVRLLYQEDNLTHSEALVREAVIKKMPRGKKKEIIQKGSPAGGLKRRIKLDNRLV